MRLEQSLLDLISIQMNCAYLSDLKFLTGAQRSSLAHKLKALTPREEDLNQWNDALVYLANVPPEASVYGAKTRLIQCLLQPGGADESGKRRSIQ